MALLSNCPLPPPPLSLTLLSLSSPHFLLLAPLLLVLLLLFLLFLFLLLLFFLFLLLLLLLFLLLLLLFLFCFVLLLLLVSLSPPDTRLFSLGLRRRHPRVVPRPSGSSGGSRRRSFFSLSTATIRAISVATYTPWYVRTTEYSCGRIYRYTRVLSPCGRTVYHEILASVNIWRISLQELIIIFSVFKFGEQHHHHPY